MDVFNAFGTRQDCASRVFCPLGPTREALAPLKRAAMNRRERQRGFQISLRAIFAGTAVVGVLLACWLYFVAPRLARRCAPAQMAALGADVYVRQGELRVAMGAAVAGDREANEIIALLSYFPTVRLSLEHNAQFGDEGIAGLAGKTNIQTLLIDAPRITNAGMRNVAQMRGVHEVSLTGAAVDCDSIAALAAIKGLRRLSVAGIHFDFCACKQIAKLADLETLQLKNLQLAAGDLRRLATLQKLTSLRLECREPAGRFFFDLAACQGLKELYISGISLPEPKPGAGYLPAAIESLTLVDCAISEAAMQRVAAVTGLKELSLRHSQIAAGGLAHIRRIAGLERLDLTRTNVTDHDLQQIAELPRLKHICVAYTKVSDAGLVALSQSKSLTSLDALDAQASEECLRRVSKAIETRQADE